MSILTYRDGLLYDSESAFNNFMHKELTDYAKFSIYVGQEDEPPDYEKQSYTDKKFEFYDSVGVESNRVTKSDAFVYVDERMLKMIKPKYISETVEINNCTKINRKEQINTKIEDIVRKDSQRKIIPHFYQDIYLADIWDLTRRKKEKRNKLEGEIELKRPNMYYYKLCFFCGCYVFNHYDIIKIHNRSQIHRFFKKLNAATHFKHNFIYNKNPKTNKPRKKHMTLLGKKLNFKMRFKKRLRHHFEEFDSVRKQDIETDSSFLYNQCGLITDFNNPNEQKDIQISNQEEIYSIIIREKKYERERDIKDDDDERDYLYSEFEYNEEIDGETFDYHYAGQGEMILMYESCIKVLFYSNDFYVCITCNVRFYKNRLISHLNSNQHKINKNEWIQSRVKNEYQNESSGHSVVVYLSSKQSNPVVCAICNVFVSLQEKNLIGHLNGKKHKINEQNKYKGCVTGSNKDLFAFKSKTKSNTDNLMHGSDLQESSVISIAEEQNMLFDNWEDFDIDKCQNEEINHDSLTNDNTFSKTEQLVHSNLVPLKSNSDKSKSKLKKSMDLQRTLKINTHKDKVRPINKQHNNTNEDFLGIWRLPSDGNFVFCVICKAPLAINEKHIREHISGRRHTDNLKIFILRKASGNNYRKEELINVSDTIDKLDKHRTGNVIGHNGILVDVKNKNFNAKSGNTDTDYFRNDYFNNYTVYNDSDYRIKNNKATQYLRFSSGTKSTNLANSDLKSGFKRDKLSKYINDKVDVQNSKNENVELVPNFPDMKYLSYDVNSVMCVVCKVKISNNVQLISQHMRGWRHRVNSGTFYYFTARVTPKSNKSKNEKSKSKSEKRKLDKNVNKYVKKK